MMKRFEALTLSCILFASIAFAQEASTPAVTDEPLVAPKVESADIPVDVAKENKATEQAEAEAKKRAEEIVNAEAKKAAVAGEPAADGMTIEVRDKKSGKKEAKKEIKKEEKKLEIKTSEVKVSKNETSAETSQRWLQNGNTRYLKKNNRADGKAQTDRRRLLSGEKPHAIVLSCSDSRVPPEIVFDQSLGEIYVVRVAGEALDSAVIASLEYAVEKLGPKLLVVMGHSHCSAVAQALAFNEGDSAGSADLERLLADIKPRLKTVVKEKQTESLEVESAVNADGVARDLVRRSELIRKKVDAGQLTIKTALYRSDTGKVTFY